MFRLPNRPESLKILAVLALFAVFLYLSVRNHSTIWAIRKNFLPPASCKYLFENGIAVGRNWKPRECLFNWYSEVKGGNLEQCFQERPKLTSKKRNYILIFGDSRARQMQITLHQKLSLIYGKDTWCDLPGAENLVWPRDLKILQTCNFTFFYPRHNLFMERWWTPIFDLENVEHRLKNLTNRDDQDLPDLIYINSGIWLGMWCWDHNVTAAHCTQQYEKNLYKVMEYLEPLGRRTHVVWAPMNMVKTELRPMQMKFEDGKNENSVLDEFNKIAERILNGSSVWWWASYYQMFHSFGDTYDGVHLGDANLHYVTNLFFSLLCNHIIKPNSTYCCS